MAHALSERYAALVAAKLNATLVTKDHVIFNTSYEGTPTAGAVKIPKRDANPVVASYSKTNLGSNGINYGSTAYITAALDNDKYVNEYIDGYEAAAVPDGIVADRLSAAGYALGASEDTIGLATLAYGIRGKGKDGNDYGSADPRYQEAGTLHAMTALDSDSSGDRLNADTAYDWAVELGKDLDENGVPAEGRYLICDPTAYAYLLKDDNFIRQGDISQELKQTGALGMVAGMAVYKSSNLPNGADITIDTTAYYGKFAMIAGHPDYATRVDEWMVQPYLADLSGDINVVGGSAVKGRWVFTHEVTSPKAFAGLTRPVSKT